MSPRWFGGIVFFFVVTAFVFGMFDVLSGAETAIFGEENLATLQDVTEVEGADVADPAGGTATFLNTARTVLEAVKEAVSFDYITLTGVWVYFKYLLLFPIAAIIIIAMALVLRRFILG